MLRPACEVTFGQSLDFSDHFLSLVHGTETLYPKHDLDLDLQRQYAAKRFILWVD